MSPWFRRAVRWALGPAEVRRSSALVAAVVTLVVAIGFAVAVATATASTQRMVLVAVDADLQRELGSLQGAPDQAPPAVGVGWVIGPAAEVVGTWGGAPALPVAERHLSGPADLTLSDGAYRLAGAPVGDRWVVVGRRLETLPGRRGPDLDTVAPMSLILLAVFVASLLIGRWAAQPIERARRQQLAFVADASHELRTPLAVVEGEVSLALTRARTAEDYRAALRRVSGETLRVRRLVDDLLWLARVESEARAAGPDRVDIGEVAARAVERFRAVAEDRRVRLRFVESAEPAVLAPAEWIERLLGVLLDNACKYTPAGGEVCVTVRTEGGRAELLVDDSGPGIPPGERTRVFRRFYRATRDGEGAGLGLSIAAAVVERTRGTCTVATSPLGGARMGISWSPAAGARSWPVPAPAQERRSTSAPRPSRRRSRPNS